MTAIYAHIEPADDLAFVWLRASANSNPEHKPAMLVARSELNDVMLMLLDAAQTEARTWRLLLALVNRMQARGHRIGGLHDSRPAARRRRQR